MRTMIKLQNRKGLWSHYSQSFGKMFEYLSTVLDTMHKRVRCNVIAVDSAVVYFAGGFPSRVIYICSSFSLTIKAQE